MFGRGILAAVLAVALVMAPAVPATAGAAAAEECQPEKGTMKLPAGEPWAQKRLDVKSAWRLTRGAGARVAVVDSGVDFRHPQLRWISKIIDVTRTGYRDRDCVGHGTAVTGIIAAKPIEGVPFYGVAPDATMIMIKQSNSTQGDPKDLVAAINEAVKNKADVINVSIKASDTPQLKAAVMNALAQDIVIVAAAGNVKNQKEEVEPAYPASYEGVLAVGSATQDGRHAETSNAATPVGVIAPGVGLLVPWTGRSYKLSEEGSSFACAYVTGVAALVRSRYPRLDQDQVRRRIIATADGAAGKGTGAGMVNPALAVSAVLPFEPAGMPVVAPPPPLPISADAIAKAPKPDTVTANIAMVVTGAALVIVLLAGAFVLVVPLGKRRGWKPGRPA
ncbi:S8 family serine peptidase [Nonomuraea sp. NBC_01738]|uniref:S8 family serine peptidase n=1 Tax=Nonomuraea sp. NBC_01738 TaxID=2976003 RepID=UPI002E10E62D|nr:S8 family serine peptidase [Nonomuraea sp. NBC_01738]